MAVEAHPLHLLRAPTMASERQPPTTEVLMPVSMSGGTSSPFYSTCAMPSQSSLTVSGCSRKRRAREAIFFSGDEISSQFQQQMLDLDLLFAHHRETMREELAERRKCFSRLLAAAIENGVRKRLKAKEDEMERLRKLNWAMEERVRSLCVENQVWRELAQTNEATVNFLRANLEQLLAAQTRGKEELQGGDEIAAADDAESCCCGGNDDEVAAPGRFCRSCGVREPTVFLLPCRHLCLCAACAPTSSFCPICSCCKSGSVHVNLF